MSAAPTAENPTPEPLEPGAPADLPDLSKLPVDERERVWYERYYVGDGVPQFTLRAVLMGGVLGMLMAISNLYTTLKIGWSFGVAITACILSYTIWNTFLGMGLAKSKMTMLENNCMQSTASAAGSSTGSTLATAAGAMLLLGGDATRLGWLPLTLWVGLVAVLGTFLAIPMKRQMINVEQLPFPSGIAAAQTLRSLYAEGDLAVKKARALIDAMIVGGVVGLLRGFGAIPEALPFINGDLPIRNEALKNRIGLGTFQGLVFEPSILLVAAGMIVGMRVSLSMLVGSIVNYFVLAPIVMSMDAWTADPTPGKHFIGQMEVVLGDDGAPTVVKVTRWSLWLGTALMVTSGITSFAMGWRTILRAFQGLGATKSAHDEKMAAIEVPTSWLVYGLVPVTIGLVGVCWYWFAIAPWLSVLSVVFAFVIALVASRATGETDTTPIGAMGKITQLTYAVLAPKDPGVNLMTAGITAGAAGSSADLLTDLKSGYLLGANPRQQFLAQVSGVFFGLLAVIPGWFLLVKDRASLEAMNPPATNMWYAVAKALSEGWETIPTSARVAILVGAVIGVVLPLLEAALPKHRKYLPSAMGLGLAFVMPFQNSLSFFLGALIAWRWTVRNPQSAEDYIVPIASGAVAGESLAAAGFAIFTVATGLIGQALGLG